MILFVLCLLFVCLFTACTENTKQDALDTDVAGATVTSNGGLAVRYGKYLYFVNGYSGESTLNTFGSVKTGAICRVELKDNVPDYTTFSVVVPKNVYGSDTTYPGIYIVGDYIYYHTTSVDKDSKREYKTDEGVLMRTKIDGSESEVLKEFDDNSTVFYVAGNYLVYEHEDYLHGIRLSDKEEIDIYTEHTALAYFFKDNYLVYTGYNYDNIRNSTGDYLVNVFNFCDGTTKVVLSSELLNNKEVAKKNNIYKFSIANVEVANDKLNIFYSITEDNTQYGFYKGYYVCSYDASLAFNVANNYRLSYELDPTTYSAFYTLKNGWILAYNSGSFAIYNTFTVDNDAKRWEKTEYDPATENRYYSCDVTDVKDVVGVYETDTEVYAYYTSSKTIDSVEGVAFNYICLLEKDGTEYTVSEGNKISFFFCKYDSTYTTYELIDNCVYYLNDQVSDIAYYGTFDAKVKAEESFKNGKVLGKVDPEKLISLIDKE